MHRSLVRTLVRGVATSARREVKETSAFSRMTNGEFHPSPIGQSDISHRTTMAPMSRDSLGLRMVIDAWSQCGFTICGNKVFGPIALFPTIVLSWRVPTVADIGPDSLEFFSLLEPKPDLVLLGVGMRENVDSIRKRMIPFFREHKLAFEILTTEQAIHIYNFANGDGRYVVAALFPPERLENVNTEIKWELREDAVGMDDRLGVDLTDKKDVLARIRSPPDLSNLSDVFPENHPGDPKRLTDKLRLLKNKEKKDNST